MESRFVLAFPPLCVTSYNSVYLWSSTPLPNTSHWFFIGFQPSLLICSLLIKQRLLNDTRTLHGQAQHISLKLDLSSHSTPPSYSPRDFRKNTSCVVARIWAPRKELIPTPITPTHNRSHFSPSLTPSLVCVCVHIIPIECCSSCVSTATDLRVGGRRGALPCAICRVQTKTMILCRPVGCVV